jgi:hypothetical protein
VEIEINEHEMQFKMQGNPKALTWYFDMSTAHNATLPFLKIEPKNINCQFEGMNYSVAITHGSFAQSGNSFRIEPEWDTIVLKLDNQ